MNDIMLLASDDPAVAAAIVGKACPDLCDMNARFIGGFVNRAFLLGERFVIRFPRDEKAHQALEREAAFCRHVRPLVTVPVPDLELHEAAGYRFSRHDKIEGEAFLTDQYDALAHERKDEIARLLADFFVTLHAIPLPAAKALGAEPLTYQSVAQMRRALQRDAFTAVRDFGFYIIDEYAALPVVTDMVFGHFDVHDQNVAFDAETGRLNGIFDFADCGLGDRHQEFQAVLEISPDLARRTIAFYETATNQEIDWRKVIVYKAIAEISDSAEYCNDANAARNLAQWRSLLFPEWTARSRVLSERFQISRP